MWRLRQRDLARAKGSRDIWDLGWQDFVDLPIIMGEIHPSYRWSINKIAKRITPEQLAEFILLREKYKGFVWPVDDVSLGLLRLISPLQYNLRISLGEGGIINQWSSHMSPAHEVSRTERKKLWRDEIDLDDHDSTPRQVSQVRMSRADKFGTTPYGFFWD